MLLSVSRRKINIPELLAPAGTKDAFIAAVESGADAIYIGGEILNARMNAGNFSLAEMKEAIDFAHKRHVKVYVTVNTLVLDEEMGEALDYCRKLYELGADALIIQDLGLGYVVKQDMPDFPLHLSTQGSIYDLAGVEAAKKLGYERVVLARELSLGEIKSICAGTEVPVEVFCHGAICICYSGQCQMSRAIGGRSGNRGGCAQPCRLAYEMKGALLAHASQTGALSRIDKKKGTASGENKYYLSPADMSLIDHLGELAEAGVQSLKIEGRMKSPEYVAVVTSIYRKYLDEYSEKGKYKVSEEDRLALAQIFSRGFTTAYLKGADENFMSGEKSKNKGVPMGKVTSIERIKNKNDRFIVTAALSDVINKNDVLEIGDAYCTVTLIEDCSSGVRLGDVVGEVKTGDEIYRMISDTQISEAEKSYKHKDWHEGKYIRRNPLDWDVISSGDGNIKVVAKDLLSGVSVAVSGGTFEEAEADASDRIREALGKTGGTPFETRGVKLRGDFNYRISVADINGMRRTAIKELESELCENPRLHSESGDSEDLVCATDNKTSGQKICEGETRECENNCDDCEKSRGTVELYFYNAKDFIESGTIEKEVRCIDGIDCVHILLPAAELIDCYDDAIKKAESVNAEIIPYIDNISKGEENDLIEKSFNPICEISKANGIYIGNINWIEKFADAGIKVFGDYGLNKYNSYTEVALKKLGATYVIDSLEKLDIGSGAFGRAPLMTTEHSFEGEGLVDRKGAEYDIIRRSFSNQEIIVLHKGESVVSAVREQRKAGENVRGIMRVYI